MVTRAKKKSGSEKKKTAKKAVSKPARKSAAKQNKAKSAAKTKKPAAKKVPTKKSESKKPARKKKSAPEKPLAKAEKKRKARSEIQIVRSTKKAESAPAPGRALTADARKKFRGMLTTLRDDVSQQIRSLQDDSLQRFDSVNSEEDGTDTSDRQFALSIASSEHDALFEIDRAMKRLDEGTYGVCEACGKHIERARLKALPFVRMCIACKSSYENTSNSFKAGEAPAAEGANRKPGARNDETS